nr:unnamed protein product [Naegleria fowleri]
MSENDLLKLSVRNNALSKVRNYESEGELPPHKSQNDIPSISPILQRSPTLDCDGKLFNTLQKSQDELFKQLGLKDLKELSDEDFAKKISNIASSASLDDIHSELPEVGDHEFEASVTQLAKLLSEADIDPKKSMDDSEMRLMTSMGKIGFAKKGSHSPAKSVPDFKSYLESHSKTDNTANGTMLGPVWDSVAPSIKSRMQRSISAFREHLTMEEGGEETLNVLNKINSEIQAGPPKKEPFTEEKWAELTQRLSRPYEKKAKKIEKIISEREEEYSKQNTFQPAINERSRLLVSSSLDDRVNTFLQEKQKNIEKKKEEVAKLEENELKFKPEITKKSQKLNRDVNLLLHWSEERKQKLESLKTAVDQEHLEPCTFKPVLSTRSRKIAEKCLKKQGTNTSFPQSTDVFERNYEWEFIKNHKKRKFIESFIRMEKALHNPNITIKASSLKRDGPFGDRLYKQGLEFLEKKEKTRENLLSALYQKRGAGCVQQKDDPYFGDAEDRVVESGSKLTEEQIYELIKQYALDVDDDPQFAEGKTQDQDKQEENIVSTPPDHEEDMFTTDPQEKYAKTMETLRLFRQSQLSQKACNE